MLILAIYDDPKLAFVTVFTRKSAEFVFVDSVFPEFNNNNKDYT